ncbi:MAG TPA: tripartite tricarboxylate transporter substrate binding protein, partial [Burkholderiales bacterium]|nr:tripartite tricarboxylate transporter substrate binding protein [Burkholderiales bacterium]
IAPFPAGGSLDIIARSLAQPMSVSLGKPVVVENRPGGTGIIGAELVARAPADGHTMLVMGSVFAIHAAVRLRLPYDAIKDFVGIARIASNPMLVSAHPSLPVQTVKELVSLASARPAQLTYASSGLASPQHLAMEAFKAMARINVIHVPYQGGAPATTAVLGGHTSISVANLSETAPYVAAGKLRAIAVTSAERSDLLKNVPTVAESGFPGFDMAIWFGAWAPAASPKEAIARVAADIARSVELPEVKSGLGKLGLSPAVMEPEQFGPFYRAEIQRYAKLASKLNLSLD